MVEKNTTRIFSGDLEAHVAERCATIPVQAVDLCSRKEQCVHDYGVLVVEACVQREVHGLGPGAVIEQPAVCEDVPELRCRG